MAVVKYYMNNPCEIVRVISENYSEVIVYPQFDEDMNGGQWCTACMMGGTSTHQCDPYQEVLEAIRDTEVSMIVVVENRLLVDEPVEFKAWDRLRKEIKRDSDRNGELREQSLIIKSQVAVANDELHAVAIEINDAKDCIAKTLTEIKMEREILIGVTNNITDKIKSVDIGGATVELGGHELKRLIANDIKMSRLEAGGVDNWEWYGESISIDGHDIDDETDKILSSFTVKIG